ncbi:MAG TPA: YbjN domain-containing protein [Acidimicrobiales bacterium]|nr:YbjN domain-containing protein [Acidimicrobiales bacterium]
MPVDAATPEELAAFTKLIHRWAERELRDNEVLIAVDHDPAECRWYVRMKGEEKSFTTVWLTLRQRTLHYETYFMPAPEENVEACYEFLLRLNQRLFGMRFAIGLEDALYLVGQMPLSALDDDELDRIIGSTYAYAEQYFRPAMRIGYATQFKG